MNVAIFGRTPKPDELKYYSELLDILKNFGWKPVIEYQLKTQLQEQIQLPENTSTFTDHADFKEGIDISISLGGDGTFIQNTTYVKDSKVPVLGINTGRLGFLANNAKEDLRQTMELIRAQRYVLQQRSLLEVETSEQLFGDDRFAINEVTLQKRDSSEMITISVYLDDHFLNSYWVDGLIVSTPTGSTAYNLSCGGPIITPDCGVHVITPMAPHNLTVRPLVVSDHSSIKLVTEGRDQNCLITVDGHSRVLKQYEEVHLKKANFSINVITFEDNHFLNTIRRKLMWGRDQRNEHN